MPSPNIIAGALIDRTRRMDVKIAVIGSALPLVSTIRWRSPRSSPCSTICRPGGCIAGFVRGIGCEYHSTEVNPIYSHERFHEAHDLIVRAWTEPGPFAFEGKHYNFGYVNTWPRWCSSRIRRSGFRRKARARPSNGRRRRSANIRSSWRSARPRRSSSSMDRIGSRPKSSATRSAVDQLGWSTPTYVAETDEIAARKSAEHLEALFNNFFHIPPELLFPPGYTSIRSLQPCWNCARGWRRRG